MSHCRCSVAYITRRHDMSPSERDISWCRDLVATPRVVALAGNTLSTSHARSTDQTIGNLPTFVKNMKNEARTTFPPLH
ncbi:hypothetical protein Taro_035301 [Colocasia esculenta]|uniref:Uncharacterized protein n=1 Tax=Colocasia esculenta TaxID=4460 RepID=A0A843W3F5_COLES|nr:hypothetical protein [Colocasia esculenta]